MSDRTYGNLKFAKVVFLIAGVGIVLAGIYLTYEAVKASLGYDSLIGIVQVASGLGTIVGGVFVLALGDLIQLLMDIEENTRLR